MKVKVTKNKGLSRTLNVTVDAFILTDSINAKLAKLANDVKIPGFRKGKIPPKVLKQRYGQSVMGEILDDIVHAYSAKALEQENINPAAQPKIDVKTFEEGKDIEFTLEVEELPEVPDIDFSKIKIPTIKVDLTDKDIEESLDRLREQFKEYSSAAKTKKAEDGLAVLIDFEGKKDGIPFEGGTAQGHQLVLGSKSFIPGFEDQLIGAKAGDKRTVDVTFPEEYHSADLAGQDVTFDVTVHEVQEVSDHPINDELASKLGCTNLDDLKEKVKTQLENDYKEMTRAHDKRELFDLLDKKCKFELPEQMFEQEFKTIWENAKAENERNPGYFDKSEDKMQEEYKEIAERRVRLGILLAGLGKKNKIEVMQQDIQQAIMKDAMNYPGQEQQILEYYQKHPEARAKFSGAVLEEKVVDFLFDKVKTEEKKMSTKQWWDLTQEEQEKSSKSSKKKASTKKKAS